MPKIVDHAKQREKIIEATWRVMLRDGIGQASVRKIAEEAGLSPGAMRHYFSTQSELLTFSMEAVSEQFEQRVRKIQFDGTRLLEYLQQVVEELLPLDEEKLRETTIWFAFVSQTGEDPQRHELSKKVYLDLRLLIENIFDALKHYDLLLPHLQRDIEVDRLYALIDGLALHKLLQSEHLPVERMRKIIHRHFASLCKDE
jgi:AcrR family transcriptional regulator